MQIALNPLRRRHGMFLPALAVALLASCGPCANTAELPSPRPESWWPERSRMFNDECREKQPRLAFLGDSITRGWAGAGKKSWEAGFARYGAVNFGIPGDRVEHLLWRLEHGNIAACDPDAAVLLIGTNNRTFNTPREIAGGVGTIIRRLLEMKPGMKVIVMSIPPCGEGPNELRGTLMKANEYIAKLHDGTSVFYVDITGAFVREGGTIPSELMPDFVHPSGAGYELIAAALRPVLRDALGK